MNGRSPIACVLRIIRSIKYRLIIGTLKWGSRFSWVQVFENTCTNRNLANELRRWFDRNRMLLEMVFQAFLDASCHSKRTLKHIKLLHDYHHYHKAILSEGKVISCTDYFAWQCDNNV